MTKIKRILLVLMALALCSGITAFADVIFPKGDADLNGGVDNLDAAIVLKYDAGLITLDSMALISADYNGDGAVDNLDAAMILRFDAGLVVTPDTKTVINIVDDSYGKGLDDAHEYFYEDDNYEYYFGCIKSHYITVYYSDGTSENVKDAFETGIVTIADLDRFGIFYNRLDIRDYNSPNDGTIVDDPPLPNSGDSPKEVDYIEDLLDGGDEALEAFYVDDGYIYYFPYIHSTGVVVHYKDGTAENIVEALEYNHVSVEQLDEYGISYYAVEKTAEEADFSVMPDSGRILSEHAGCGVKTEGFVNVDSDPITCADEAIEKARLECTVEYDTVTTHYSHTSHIWAVHFSMSDTAGGDQTVYLNQSGVTLYVFYGE